MIHDSQKDSDFCDYHSRLYARLIVDMFWSVSFKTDTLEIDNAG